MTKGSYKPIILAAMLLFLMFTKANAEYCAVGPIEGNVCKGFIIESCKFVRVDAVKGDDGQLYTVNNCYEKVTEYKKSKGRCWIDTKSKGAGALSWALNAVSQPEFYHKNEAGEYEELDLEYITFQCIER